MALAGVHIVLSQAISPSGETPLPFSAHSSQTISSPGTTSLVAPEYPYQDLSPTWLLSINASAPIFYATGPSPDPVNGPRRYMDPASGRDDIYVNSGDKFAWVFA